MRDRNTPKNPRVRFLRFVEEDRETGCWIWLGHCQIRQGKRAYGTFSFGLRPVLAHRWAYQHIGGKEFTPGLQLDHICRNPICVNPAHLEEVDANTNLKRGDSPSTINAAKVRCIRGHEFTQENTRIDKKGRRSCRQCYRERYHTPNHKMGEVASHSIGEVN